MDKLDITIRESWSLAEAKIVGQDRPDNIRQNEVVTTIGWTGGSQGSHAMGLDIYNKQRRSPVRGGCGNRRFMQRAPGGWSQSMDIHQLKLNMTSTVPPPLKLPSCSTYKATKLTELGTCTERSHVTGLFQRQSKAALCSVLVEMARVLLHTCWDPIWGLQMLVSQAYAFLSGLTTDIPFLHCQNGRLTETKFSSSLTWPLPCPPLLENAVPSLEDIEVSLSYHLFEAKHSQHTQEPPKISIKERDKKGISARHT